jgi:hypothetical protein
VSGVKHSFRSGGMIVAHHDGDLAVVGYAGVALRASRKARVVAQRHGRFTV